MIVLIVKSTENYHKGLQISIAILCAVTLKCHYWITNFFSCCNIILCWLPAWAEIWNCHPQTCKSDSTSLIRKVKLNIHSQAAFQVQTVWSSLRQNVFNLKHIFLHFHAAKIQNGYHRWTNPKAIIYFELYTGGELDFSSSFCNPSIVMGLLHLSPLSGNLNVWVCGCCLLLHFLYVSCSSINQVVKHRSIRWKCNCVYVRHQDRGLRDGRYAD